MFYISNIKHFSCGLELEDLNNLNWLILCFLPIYSVLFIVVQFQTSCVDVCTDNYVQFNQRFMFNFVDHQERRKQDLERAAAEAAAKEQEEQQKQLQQAAAAFAAGQEQAAADMAAASTSSSPVLADIPLKTGQATELLENLAAAGATAASVTTSQNLPVSSTATERLEQEAK